MKFTSPVWSAVSGSVGGTTYGRGPFGGLVARSRATPSNPNTLPQQNARASLGAASAAWAGLGAANRQAWEDYAALTPLTGPLGESITVGGLQMYQRWASLRGLAGESVATPSPIATSGLGLPPTGIAAASMVPLWTVTVAVGASDDGDVLIQVSPSLSAGMNSVKRPLVLDVFAPIAAAATTVTATPVITIATGERYVVRTRIIYDDGRVSALFTQIVTVTA